MPSPDFSTDLDLGEPPPEIQEYARQHIGEDPSTRLQAIYQLRDMIYERGECSPHRLDDAFLLRFLRARDFIPAKAHRLIVNYYNFREENPELFENIYPLDLRQIGDTNVIAVPPYRDQNGRRLLMYRIGGWDPKAITVDDMFRGTILALEMGLFEPRTQVLGGVAVFDMEDIGTQHAWQMTPSVASKMIKLLVSAFPTRTHAIHLINHSWVFDKIYGVIKPLLNAQMRQRIFFHSDLASLHEHIHPDHLPEKYGGIWPDYPLTMWLESLNKNYNVAKEMLASGYKLREEDIAPEVCRRLQEEGIKLA